MFHKITNLVLLEDYVLLVGFKEGVWKRLDLKPLMKKYPAFLQLKENSLYQKGKIDLGGFGVVWNEDVDLSAEGIFEQGEETAHEISSIKNMFAEYLKELREKNTLSQNDLSRLSGVSQSTIARIEKGDIDPTLTTAEKLLSPFGVTLSIS